MSFLSKALLCLTGAAATLLPSLPLSAQSDSIRLFHIGLVYPVSSNGIKAADYTNRLSLHGIAGVSRAETGVALYGAAGIVKENTDGVIASGSLNLIGGDARGLLLSGAMNVVGGTSTGLQAAGVANVARASQGAAFAGVANLSEGGAGTQIAGVLNKAIYADNQVAGLINVAKRVKGVQIAGLINIADSSDYPIAVLNFIKNGEKSVALTMDETLTGMASFRSGGRVLYGILGIGYNFRSHEKPVYGVESGLGAHISLGNYFRINTEITNQHLSDFRKGQYVKHSLRILPAVKTGSLEFFAGPTVNYLNYCEGKDFGGIDRFLWSRQRSRDFQGIYLGVVGGIQYCW